jgi:hypothetical protein
LEHRNSGPGGIHLAFSPEFELCHPRFLLFEHPRTLSSKHHEDWRFQQHCSREFKLGTLLVSVHRVLSRDHLAFISHCRSHCLPPIARSHYNANVMSESRYKRHLMFRRTLPLFHGPKPPRSTSVVHIMRNIPPSDENLDPHEDANPRKRSTALQLGPRKKA